MVHYPIAGGAADQHRGDRTEPEPVEGWAAPGVAELLLAQYAKAAAPLRALLAEPPNGCAGRCSTGRQDLAQGRVALLGDAAHPVLPFLAQGAALAIEDAATLASLLSADPAMSRPR